MRAGPVPRAVALGLAMLLLASCGGGGGSASAPVAPGIGAATPAPSQGSGSLSFKIATPAGSSARAVTVTLAGQTTALATVNLTGSSTTASVSAPAGNDVFVVSTYDGANATGHLLSTARVPATVSTTAGTVVPLAVSGTVATTAVILGATSAPVGAAASIAVTVVAYDASNNILVGNFAAGSPVTLADVDASGNTTLSATTVGAPGTSVTLTYNGNSDVGATITPTYNGTAGTSATFAPAGTAVANYLLPSIGAVVPGAIDNLDSLAAGGDGKIWFGTFSANTFGTVAPGGAVNVFADNPIAEDTALVAGAGGTMYFGDYSNNIGTVSETGALTYATQFTNLPCLNTTSTCGTPIWMVLGPDQNVWFADDAGYIGRVTPALVVQEWRITTLPGWTGSISDPHQIAFGTDGNLYVADTIGYLEKITIAGDQPTGVTNLSVGCGGVYGVAFGTDGNVWFADACENVGMVPFGNFAEGAALTWTVASFLSPNACQLEQLIASPGGLWATDDTTGTIFQITNLAGVTATQGPTIISTVAFPNPDAEAYALTLGPDGNIWAATLNPGGSALAKVIFGAPGGPATLSAKRLTAGMKRTPNTSPGANYPRRHHLHFHHHHRTGSSAQ